MKYQFEIILVKSWLISLINLVSWFNLSFSWSFFYKGMFKLNLKLSHSYTILGLAANRKGLNTLCSNVYCSAKDNFRKKLGISTTLPICIKSVLHRLSDAFHRLVVCAFILEKLIFLISVGTNLSLFQVVPF